MNSLITIGRNSRLLVESCVGLRAGETVLIVTDADNRLYGDALAAAADQAGAAVVVMDASQQVIAVQQGRPAQAPPPLAAAIREANVTLILTDPEFSQRFSHKLHEIAPAMETRSYFQVDPGMDSWNLTSDDLAVMQKCATQIMLAVNRSKRIRITTAKGTDVVTSVGDRDCLLVVPQPARGSVNAACSIPLWAEANWAPIDDATEGTVVIDGIMMGTGPEVGTVSQPIRWTVRGGKVVDIEGGLEAQRLNETLRRYDSSARVIAELGIGASEKAQFGGMEEKARLGTIHFAIGDSTVYPGGTNKSPIHLDGTIREVTIEVDGRTILRNGRLSEADPVA